MAMLVVVGLLIGTLTWRYWRYSDPKRGLAPSRARLPVGRTTARVEGTGGEVVLSEPSVAAPAAPAPAGGPFGLEPVGAEAEPTDWVASVPEGVELHGAGGAAFEPTQVYVTQDPTDPGGWAVPDREPVRSD
jgi:hypothetical protein